MRKHVGKVSSCVILGRSECGAPVGTSKVGDHCARGAGRSWPCGFLWRVILGEDRKKDAKI